MTHRTRGNRLLRRAERVAGCQLPVAGFGLSVRGVAIRVVGLVSIILFSLVTTFCTRPVTKSNHEESANENFALTFENRLERSNRHRQLITGNRKLFSTREDSLRTFGNNSTRSTRHRQPETGNWQPFLSAQYNHFEGGKLFTDVREGLDVMWHASFKSGKPYKENLGFILPEGLLVIPNKGNTSTSAQLSVYPKWVENGKLLLLYNGNIYEVLAIAHTHPLRTLTEPAPRKDYQYCYMGIHNFVISHYYIYDAWKDKNGNEIFRRIGKRTEYERLMAVVRRDFAHLSP